MLKMLKENKKSTLNYVYFIQLLKLTPIFFNGHILTFTLGSILLCIRFCNFLFVISIC